MLTHSPGEMTKCPSSHGLKLQGQDLWVIFANLYIKDLHTPKIQLLMHPKHTTGVDVELIFTSLPTLHFPVGKASLAVKYENKLQRRGRWVFQVLGEMQSWQGGGTMVGMEGGRWVESGTKLGGPEEKQRRLEIEGIGMMYQGLQKPQGNACQEGTKGAGAAWGQESDRTKYQEGKSFCLIFRPKRPMATCRWSTWSLI